MPQERTISLEVASTPSSRDFAAEIAAATVRGDLEAMTRLAIELAALVKAGEALAIRDRERKARQLERVRRHRELRAFESRDATSRNVTQRDSALQGVTPPSPLVPSPPSLALSPSTPLNPLSPREEVPEFFAEAWATYPRRNGTNNRRDAQRAFAARLREGVSASELLAGVQRYAVWCQATDKLDTELVMQAARFFGPARPFESEWALPAAPHERGESAEEAVVEIRYMAAAVEGRRQRADGDAWWARMQREANTTNKRTELRYAFEHCLG